MLDIKKLNIHIYNFYRCTVYSGICSLHNKCTYINLKTHIKMYNKINLNIAPTCYVSVFDHHQGACTEPS